MSTNHRFDTLAQRAWRWRWWLAGASLLVPLLPLAYGQGWIGEAVMILLPFRRPPEGIAYFLQPSIEPTRIFNSLPFAVALLTPWPEWVIAAVTVLAWLATAVVTYRVTRRLIPEDARAAVIALFLAGTSAYDVSLLQSAYLPLFLAALLHWVGLLAMLAYCERPSLTALAGSSMLQASSLFTYATAVGAIAVGPALAFAFAAMRRGPREAWRPAVNVAVAWWLPLCLYLAALASVVARPGNYVTSLGGLQIPPPLEFGLILARSLERNFDVLGWLRHVSLFGDPPRVLPAAVVAALAALGAIGMLLVVAGVPREGRDAARPVAMRWVLLALLAAVFASNAATALTKSADAIFRTHLVSRLYASVILAACMASLLASSRPAVRRIGALVVVAYIGVGAWTVADRADYLVSIWPRQRTELRSLDAELRRIDPAAGVVLYVPSGVGYIATVAPWHARPWSELVRGPQRTLPMFALWSPDRGSRCEVSGTDLVCEGDLQAPQRIPLERLVVLRYDPADCRIRIVDGAWVGSGDASPPAGYAPRAWIRDPPDEPSKLIRRVLYGPQGLGGRAGCG